MQTNLGTTRIKLTSKTWRHELKGMRPGALEIELAKKQTRLGKWIATSIEKGKGGEEFLKLVSEISYLKQEIKRRKSL